MPKRILCIYIVGLTLMFAADMRADQFGIKGGPNLARTSGIEFAGWMAGVFFRWDLSPSLSFQPEVYFSPREWKSTFEGYSETTYKYNYIQLPFLLKLRLRSSNVRISPHLFLGLFMGLRTAGTYRTRYYRDDTERIMDTDTEKDYGLVFGSGIDIHFKRGSVIIDARVTSSRGLGLFSLLSRGSSFGGPFISVLVGYAFGKNR